MRVVEWPEQREGQWLWQRGSVTREGGPDWSVAVRRAVSGQARGRITAVGGVVSDSPVAPAWLPPEGRGPWGRRAGLGPAGKASPPPSSRDAPGGPGRAAVGAAGKGVRGEEGEECWHRGAAQGWAHSQNCPSSCSLLYRTFLAELLQDKRKQNTCREGAEGAERELLLCSRVWSPSFAAQESDKQTSRETEMILTSQGSERWTGSIESHCGLLCQKR